MQPATTTFIPQTAVYAGYRTISLAWDNFRGTRSDWCNDGTYNGGQCDDGCNFATGLEMLTGSEHGNTLYDAHRMRGIEGRLRLALEHLYEIDVNDDAVNDHGWDEFCSPTGLDWSRIEVGGFSAGAQMASFISYVEPGLSGGADISLFSVEGGVDYCDFDPLSSNDPALDYFPDEYADHTHFPPCGYSGVDPGDECDETPRFLFVHDDGLDP